MDLADPRAEFGCVLFDLIEDETGKMIPRLGSGWAAVEGSKAERIKSVDDLPSHVMWWTNMTKDQLWLSGGVRFQKLRHSAYLGIDMGAVMKETGIMPKATGPTVATSLLSEVFSRTMKKMRRYLSQQIFTSPDLKDDVKMAFGISETPRDVLLDTAMFCAWQENAYLANESDGFFIHLKLPRVEHAKNIASVDLPAGEWQYASPREMPSEASRFDWFAHAGRPALVKVKFGDLKTNGSLLSRIDGLAKGTRKREKEWMTFEEASWWSAFQNITIVGGFIANGSMKHPIYDLIKEEPPMASLSFSTSLCCEALWMGVSGYGKHPTSKKMVMVPSSAVWMRAADRFHCFSKALEMHKKGFKVISYGNGTVLLELQIKDLLRLENEAAEVGLIIPASFWDNGKPSMQKDPLDLRG